MEEHQLTIGDRAAGRLGSPKERGPGIDQVQDEQVGVERLGRNRARITGQSDGRGIDQDTSLGQLGFDDRVMPRHCPKLHVGRALGEVLDHALGPVEVPIEHHDALEAFGDQAVDDRPGASTRTEHHRLAWHFLLPDQPIEGDLEAGHVGVVPDQPLALPGDRVDRAGVVGFLGQAIDHGDDPLLVRDRHVRPEKRIGAKFGHRLGELDRRPVPRLVRRVDAQGIKGGLLHGTRKRMGHRVADQDHALCHARTLSRSSKKPG